MNILLILNFLLLSCNRLNLESKHTLLTEQNTKKVSIEQNLNKDTDENKDKEKRYTRNKDGCLPLHIAAKGDKRAFISMLDSYLKDKEGLAALNAVDNEERTVLHHAALVGNADIISDLLIRTHMLYSKIKVNPNAKDIYGNLPLHLAVQSGNGFSVLLLSNKADKVDINAVNKQDETPLDLANKLAEDCPGKTYIIELLNEKINSLSNTK